MGEGGGGEGVVVVGNVVVGVGRVVGEAWGITWEGNQPC